jgi:riboflavin synthase
VFTGIIQAVGEIAAIEPAGGDMRLRIRSGKLPLSDVALGDSIATSGVCLTVTELPGDGYWADVSLETLRLTTLGARKVGDAVNLEKSLTPQTALGGHIVSGHVDGVGEIVRVGRDGRSWTYTVAAPPDLARYIAHKGSICIDGTSLTVNAVNGVEFELNIIPQTWEETVFQFYTEGSKVNLEVDVIARYLERLLQGDRAADPTAGGVTLETLRAAGYASE